MFMEHLIELLVPYVIHGLEAMGILVIAVAGFKAFVHYARNIFRLGSDRNLKVEMGKALAFALEFKLGAEILKTVIIRTLDEMFILAAIIGLRALLAFVIHWEIGAETAEMNRHKN